MPWPEVIRATRELRDRLSALGLASWAKTTGGKGLHIVVPLVPSADWDTCPGFARALAQLMAREEPARYVAGISKAKRTRLILDDAAAASGCAPR